MLLSSTSDHDYPQPPSTCFSSFSLLRWHLHKHTHQRFSSRDICHATPTCINSSLMAANDHYRSTVWWIHLNTTDLKGRSSRKASHSSTIQKQLKPFPASRRPHPPLGRKVTNRSAITSSYSSATQKIHVLQRLDSHSATNTVTRSHNDEIRTPECWSKWYVLDRENSMIAQSVVVRNQCDRDTNWRKVNEWLWKLHQPSLLQCN